MCILCTYAGDYELIVFDATEDTICLDTLKFTVDEIDGYIQQQTSTMKVESGGIQPFSYSWTMNGDIQVNQTDSIYEVDYVLVIYLYYY